MLTARSKHETEAKLDGFLVPRWKREGAAMPEGLKSARFGKVSKKSQEIRLG